MGNFIFGHGHDYWMDNIAVRLHLDAEGVTRLDVLPIAGRGDDPSQPYLLEGEAARTLLEDIRARSAGLGTTLRIEGDAGVIDVSR
ncbi:MAG: hypothetical protein F4Y74_04250 [Gemmatimonadales bacterium]|nr:hypothetical protein [Gemmatimonadales bacterium]MYG18565.1 hypothetical protein [Gemmatimonadales bacterium]